MRLAAVYFFQPRGMFFSFVSQEVMKVDSKNTEFRARSPKNFIKNKTHRKQIFSLQMVMFHHQTFIIIIISFTVGFCVLCVILNINTSKYLTLQEIDAVNFVLFIFFKCNFIFLQNYSLLRLQQNSWSFSFIFSWELLVCYFWPAFSYF